MSDDPVTMLERSFARSGAIIKGVKPEQFAAPTSCREFNVRDLMNHLLPLPRVVAAMANDEPLDLSIIDHDFVADHDYVGAWERSAKLAVAGWRTPGSFDRTVPFPWWGEAPVRYVFWGHLNECVIHGWELARATGQPEDVDEDIAQYLLDNLEEWWLPAFRGRGLSDDDFASERSMHEGGRPFGPAIPVPEDAPVFERLLGFMGRTP